jgi:hypothetical protein
VRFHDEVRPFRKGKEDKCSSWQMLKWKRSYKWFIIFAKKKTMKRKMTDFEVETNFCKRGED